MQIILVKHAHPMDLICAGEFSGCFVAVFRESRKIDGQTMLTFSSAVSEELKNENIEMEIKKHHKKKRR
jgi:hypothetical protein